MATCLMKQQMERNMLLRTMEPTSFTFVDQVGIFRDTDPASFSPNPSSGTQTPKSAMAYGDQN